MKWFLDVGNSKAKLVFVENSEWKLVAELKKEKYQEMGLWLLEYIKPTEKGLISSVIDLDFFGLLQSEIQYSVLTRAHIKDERLQYKTKTTLGLDRFLACEGAYQQSKKTVLVIDAGTAVTIDVMDEQGVFQGGVIAPGLRLFENGLHQFAPALPNVEREIPDSWPPKSTTEALQWGISGGFLEMVKGLVNQWITHYPQAEIWCTGGDGLWLSTYLERAVFDAFLVQKGMSYYAA
ncbi:type III pantothenate kinase [bacterium]|nr:MAG: type III pantothenate kinase [bacterium]